MSCTLQIWFDGGTGPSASEIGPVVGEAAPNAVCHSCWSNFTKAGSVRWMGNEEGMMPLPSWGGSAGDGSKGGNGNPLEDAFMPPSSDAVLREHYWFYQKNTDRSLKTTKKLVGARQSRRRAVFPIVLFVRTDLLAPISTKTRRGALN